MKISKSDWEIIQDNYKFYGMRIERDGNTLVAYIPEFKEESTRYYYSLSDAEGDFYRLAEEGQERRDNM